MNNQLKFELYSHPLFGQLTTAQLDDGTILFKANDVATALGYSTSKGIINKHCDNVTYLSIPTAGGKQRTRFIGQADLLKFVMRSRLPEAEKFRSWICEKVIPGVHDEVKKPSEDIKETAQASLDKAVKAIKFKCELGYFTLVMTEKGENLFIANEIVRLFRFRDEEECICNYADDARPILIMTDAGYQPVICISMQDFIRLAGKSILPEAKTLAYRFHLDQKDMEIESLKAQNLLLADDLNCAIDGLKDIREQLDSLLSDLDVNG